MSDDHEPAATRPGTLQVAGTTLPLATVLGAEAKLAESPVRNGFLLLTGMLFPIAAMVAFTVLHGPLMWGVGLVLAAGPFIAAAVSFLWAKPWGVIVETAERYRCIHIARSKAEAETLAAEINAAIA